MRTMFGALKIYTLTFILVLITYECSGAKQSELKCYNCRVNICTHAYCNVTNELLDSWKNIPICPEDIKKLEGKDNNNDTSTEKSYVQTCPQTNEQASCGRLTYSLLAKLNKNILPAGNETIVPVIGSGQEKLTSKVIVFGCILQDEKCNSSGFSQNYTIPSSSNSNNSNETSVSVVTVKNTHTSCCHCDKKMCNSPDGIFTCSADGNKPSNDPGVVSSANFMFFASESIVLVIAFIISF